MTWTGAGTSAPKDWDPPLEQTYLACNRGAHGSYIGDPEGLVSDTRALVKKLATLS